MDETTDTRRTDAWPAPLDLQRPWTKAEVCGWFDISENTLHTLIKDAGFPPPTMLGGLRLPRWRFADVDRWWQGQVEATRPVQATAATASPVGPVHNPGAGRKLGVVDRQRHKASR
jgi:predicted DNA-binding transcriptional regulator AlpA